MVMSNPKIWAIPRHQVRTLVPGPHLSFMASSEIPSFLPSLRSGVHEDPLYSWSWSLLGPALYQWPSPIAWSRRKAFCSSSSPPGFGRHVRVYHIPPCRHPSTISTLLLPHHAAKSWPLKLDASPSSTRLQIPSQSFLQDQPQQWGPKHRTPLQKTSVVISPGSSFLLIL